MSEHAPECNWRMVPLGEIADIKLGKMLDRAKHTSGRKLPYLRNVNVRWGAIDADDLLEMHFRDDEIERFSIRTNDVLVCEGGEPGRAAVWLGESTELKFQKALHRVRFRVPFEPRLLVYYLEYLAKSGGLDRRFTGSTIKHFTREAFIQLPVPTLPLFEQQRIVAEIEKQFTRLDDAVKALERSQRSLRRYRASVLKSALSGGLFESAGVDASERLYAPGVGSQSMPSTWSLERVDQIAEIGSGNTPPNIDEHVLPEGEIPWFKVADMNHPDNRVVMRRSDRWLTAESVRKLRLRVFQPGTILFPKRGGAIATNKKRRLDRPAACDLNVMGLTPRPDLADYFHWWFQSVDLAQLSDGSNVPQINNKDIAPLSVAIPPQADRQRIVTEIERRFSVIDELSAIVDANLRRAANLRQAILDRAFSGQL